jgi:hypothetical protein
MREYKVSWNTIYDKGAGKYHTGTLQAVSAESEEEAIEVAKEYIADSIALKNCDCVNFRAE